MGHFEPRPSGWRWRKLQHTRPAVQGSPGVADATIQCGLGRCGPRQRIAFSLEGFGNKERHLKALAGI